ncbi:hypothetical protein [Pseudoduganella sp. SL102]|uniref:hypothetical protein n=1 Tax=Pseudoduganella sp. SL102 TaxID=2995154 RepID=UPI0027D96989|nr:hypothetical protein [Pseudoduganella sp. SL102]
MPGAAFGIVLLTIDSQATASKVLNIMDWFPIVAGTFKVLALATGMFYAIKWHYDQGKKGKEKVAEKRAVLRAAGTVAAVFLLSLSALALVAFALLRVLGNDLSFP